MDVKKVEEVVETPSEETVEVVAETPAVEAVEKVSEVAVETVAPEPEPTPAPTPEPVIEQKPDEPAKPKRRGWWSLK